MAADLEPGAPGVELWLWRGPAAENKDESGGDGHWPGGGERFDIYDDADDPGREIVRWQQPAGAEPPAGLGWPSGQSLSGRVVSDRGDPESSASYMLVVGFAVPSDAVDRFDDWYETEHGPLLLKAEGWLRIRRLEVGSATGVDWTHVAVHDLASLAVLDSPERDAAREGPKRQQFVAEDWYQRSGRWMGSRSGQL